MQFTRNTILEFFDSSQKHFIIPVYQRAYSWEEKEWDTFLSDLKEQIKGNNNYFYGNILLEAIQQGKEYEIIDGQQRITTLIIFIRALLDVLKKRCQKEKDIDIDFSSKERIYLKDGGNIKLRPVEYDRACFDVLIIDGKDKYTTATPSQKRIKEAKEYFYKTLSEIETSELIAILNKIESTILTRIELEGKKDSALMFELQNNRGKDLTNMEKLKSYFMYQMYVYSPEKETENNIEHISNIFKAIYLIVNDLKMGEDSVLIYHCNAFLDGYGYSYRTLDDIKDVLKLSKDKVVWIKEFIKELHTSFSSIKKMENSQLPYLEDIRNLGIPVFAYPFILKGYKYLGDDEKKLNTLYHILEIVVFRYELINTKAYIISRLNEILIAFEGNLLKLKNHLKEKLNSEGYWSDFSMESYLKGYMYGNNTLHYLLWKYENFLQIHNYKIIIAELEDEQIEHIAPQKPTNGDPIATGYDVDKNNEYSDTFEENLLNCIGNLMLISGKHNRVIGNKPFSNKLKSYKEILLLKQQIEIANFLEQGKIKWCANEINKRKDKIVQFSISKWDFDSVTIMTN